LAPGWLVGVVAEPPGGDGPAVGQVVRQWALGRLESRGEQGRYACQVRRLSPGAYRGEAQVIMPELGDSGEKLASQPAAAESGRKPPAHLNAVQVQGSRSGSQAAGQVHGQQRRVAVPEVMRSAAWFHCKQASAPTFGYQLTGSPAEPSLRLRITCRGAQDRPISFGWCLQPQIGGGQNVMTP